MGATLNGIEMDWRERGAGDALLFIHGFPLNSAMWEPQLAHLPRGWRGIAPDLRGFGATTAGPEEVYVMELFARDLAALLDHLEIRHVVLCSLSMGGYIAFQFWRLQRDRVRALVLCDTRAGPDSTEARNARHALAERARAEGVGPVVEAMLPKLVAPATTIDQPGVVQLVEAMIREAAPESIARTLLGLAERPDAAPILSTINVPVLVVAGAQDQIVSDEQTEDLAKGIRGARLETIDDAGHLPNLEQPDVFNRLLARFLAGVPSVSRALEASRF